MLAAGLSGRVSTLAAYLRAAGAAVGVGELLAAHRPAGLPIALEEERLRLGTGAPDVLWEFGRYYVVHHYYDADADGVIRMQIREIEWRDGWPYFPPD